MAGGDPSGCFPPGGCSGARPVGWLGSSGGSRYIFWLLTTTIKAGGLCPSVHLPISLPASEELAQLPDLWVLRSWRPASGQKVGGAHPAITYVEEGQRTARDGPASAVRRPRSPQHTHSHGLALPGHGAFRLPQIPSSRFQPPPFDPPSPWQPLVCFLSLAFSRMSPKCSHTVCSQSGSAHGA